MSCVCGASVVRKLLAVVQTISETRLKSGNNVTVFLLWEPVVRFIRKLSLTRVLKFIEVEGNENRKNVIDLSSSNKKENKIKNVIGSINFDIQDWILAGWISNYRLLKSLYSVTFKTNQFRSFACCYDTIILLLSVFPFFVYHL